MRRKMGAMPPSPAPMDESEQMGGDEPNNEPAAGSDDSSPTTFLSKEMGGGKQRKPGDEIVLKVIAVDPETGEMQVKCAPEKGDESASEEPTDTMSAMDKMLPDDSMEG